ncbi:myoD family inhibitor isoform X2 [Sapajus apella]|uniref:MyoD family inhibitor isoform X2 n=1 Tax=Sapajus apella TaxID=9515 RepID=A0A6J3FUW4_SAPAP|nr:myoD family inhibitor isoform X2 [Sapajus apella]
MEPPAQPRAQTLSLLPGLEVVTGSTHPEEAAPEEGSLEEAATPMPQGNGPGVSQALDSTDLDVPTEAVTCQPQGNPLGCTPLLPNGSGHPSELGSTRQAGNGALSGPKAHRKLQTHASLASQGSKKSKSSTKSTASQIPLQAQEGRKKDHVAEQNGAGAGLQGAMGGQRIETPRQLLCLQHKDLRRAAGQPAPSSPAIRLLCPLHPVLPVLRVPDAVQHCPGLRHLRLLQLRGLVPLLLLLRLRRVC